MSWAKMIDNRAVNLSTTIELGIIIVMNPLKFGAIQQKSPFLKMNFQWYQKFIGTFYISTLNEFFQFFRQNWPHITPYMIGKLILSYFFSSYHC